MVNSFEPPQPKSLPEAALFQILSEIPADSVGMQRAAELIAEHERLLAEDAQEIAAWVAELEADGSAEALAALARQRGEQQPLSDVTTAPTREAKARRPTKPEPARASFESLLTGSSPVIVDSTQSSPAVSRNSKGAQARLVDYLYLPAALALGLFGANLSASQSAVIVISVLCGALLALVSARGGVRFAGQLANIAFGVSLGRIGFGVILAISMVLLSGPIAHSYATGEWVSDEIDWLIAAGSLVVILALAASSSRWIPRALLLLPLAASAWLAFNSRISVFEFQLLQLSDAALAGAAVFAGFWIQSLTLPATKSSRYGFTAVLVALAAAGGIFGSAVEVSTEGRALGLTASALLLMYGVGREAAMSARRAKISRFLALTPLALVGVWVFSPLYTLALGPWLAIAGCAFIGVVLSDALLRSGPVHEASAEESFGFYGGFSLSALSTWIISVATSVLILGLAGELDFGFEPLLEAPWLDQYSVALVALVVALLVGMLRFLVVRTRELDQRSASRDTKLESLLGL